ncbi:MAG TPA: LysE family transporter [Feifaniaceae bacterium]|nr:LysE family transporter [Feifaniaceae bacterium]
MFSFPNFLAYVLLSTFTPGPNNIMSMGNASRAGLKKSLPFCFGVAAGFALIMAASFLLGTLLYTVIPAVKPYMLLLGAAYILYLAYKVYKSDGVGEDHAAQATGFWAAVALQFVNPKGVIYGITVASAYILPYYQEPRTLLLFTLFMCFICLVSTVAWAAFGSVFQKLFTKHAKAVNTMMALLLVYCAVSLFL